MAVKSEIGIWTNDLSGLPCFDYTGKLPYFVFLPDGKKVKLPDDPWFLLGNYQLTVFTHVSGEYELITGQRAWGRLNQGQRKNSGLNRAVLEMTGTDNIPQRFSLTGIDSLASNPSVCKRVFGCGFAHYAYSINGLFVERNLSVKPSTTPYNGTSAFLLTVTVSNKSENNIKIIYEEAVTANYTETQFQSLPAESRKVKYENTPFFNKEKNLIGIKIQGITEDPLLFATDEAMSKYEGYPPSLFIHALSENTELTTKNNELCATYAFSLQPGESRTLQVIIGYTFEKGVSSIDNILYELTGHTSLGIVSAYSDDWLKILPDFKNENDIQLRQELIWHAYVLEAMASYSNYYKETKIPQGTIYDYDWGAHASARDHFQHALPLVFYNPNLARSVLRYMMKRTTAFGDIRLMEIGFGYGSNERYFTSDQQLFFFMLLSAYLKETNNYQFLNEKVECFPPSEQHKLRVIEFIEKCFIFLRDEINTGEHGLVRLLNSDWNDAVYYIENIPYNKTLFSGESHMNSAMAISILQDLIPQLQSVEEKFNIEKLVKSMQLYRSAILDAFMKDMGERFFPRRMYFAGKPYGDTNMFLEPQGYTLMIKELSNDKKRQLYNEMCKRLYNGEKLGAREQQTPEFEDNEFDKGSRENGGFWWALNAPVILGVSQFDKAEAIRLLKNMTLAHCASSFPLYWSSYWSSADNVESSLIPEEGLPDQSGSFADIPVFCAHQHAWILYCYFELLSSNNI
jgi:cellobiose phosphorylase